MSMYNLPPVYNNMITRHVNTKAPGVNKVTGSRSDWKSKYIPEKFKHFVFSDRSVNRVNLRRQWILDSTSKYPTCCISNHRFLGVVQNHRPFSTFPIIISSVIAIIKAGNTEICCRLRIFILFSIANLRMRLLRLFRCFLKEEIGRIMNMRRKFKFAPVENMVNATFAHAVSKCGIYHLVL